MFGYLGSSEENELISGRRFAETEFLTFLVMLVRRWTIHLKKGWTEERMREAINSDATILTLMPTGPMSVKFKRRT